MPAGTLTGANKEYGMSSSINRICVYASSSNAVNDHYKAVAAQLGSLIGARQGTLVYGAGNVGLMGVCAEAVHASGGRVVGVIPDRLVNLELAYREADELIVTETMRERKAIMIDRAEAFIALPGSIGTLEEIIEVLVLKQLGYHDKPCVFINTHGFYDWLFAFFGTLVEENFLKESSLDMFAVCEAPESALEYIDGYIPHPVPGKWF